MGCFLGMSASFHQKESGTKPGTVQYDLGAAAGTVANFSGAGAGAEAPIGWIVGLFAAVVGCPLGGVEAGAVIGTVAGFIFGLGYTVGQSEAGVYG